MRRNAIFFLTLCYVVGLVELTLIRFPQPAPMVNLIPLKTIIACWEAGGTLMVLNLAGNLVLLAPFGLLLAWASGGKIGPGRALIAGGGLSLGIESMQYLCGHRMADVDDILLNMVGTLLGYSAFETCRSIRRVAWLQGIRMATSPAACPPERLRPTRG